MHKQLVTMYAGTHEAFRPVTEPALERFAARHEYSVVEADVDPRYHPAWSKLPAMIAGLAEHDAVLWVDADAYLVDDDADPAEQLRADTFLVTLADMRYGACSALFALRACPTSSAFLEEAWAMRFQDFPDWDQGAIQRLVGQPEYAHGVKRLGWDWYGPEGSNPTGRIIHGCRQTAGTVPERAALLQRRIAARQA